MRPVFLIGLFAVGALFDWWWRRYFSIGGVGPSWLLVTTIALAALDGPVPAQLIGFVWGLVLDAFGVHLFGANALALSLTAYLVGRGRRLLDLSSPPSQAVLVAFLSIGYALFYATLGSIFLEEFLWPGWRGVFGVPLANALAAPFVFYYLRGKQTVPVR